MSLLTDAMAIAVNEAKPREREEGYIPNYIFPRTTRRKQCCIIAFVLIVIGIAVGVGYTETQKKLAGATN